MFRKSTTGSGNTKAILLLAGVVLLISLGLALGAGKSPILADWYSASGVLVAAVGSVAVLSLVQSERQEAERNRRESALLTLQKCEQLRPVMQRLSDAHDRFASTRTGKQLAASSQLLQGRPATHDEFERLLLHDARQFVETGSPAIVTTDQRPKTEAELQASTLQQLERVRQGIDRELTQHLSELRPILAEIDSIAVFLLEAECNLSLAHKVIGAEYAALIRKMIVSLAALDAGARVGGFPFALRLQREFVALEKADSQAEGPSNLAAPSVA